MIGSLSMDWRGVVFANWPVDPTVVRPHVPDVLELDRHDGCAWLSIVAIETADVRPPWVPSGLGQRIAAVNLRTYVTHGDDDGVYFFSLDAESIPAVLGGRLFHHLPYYYARVDRTVEADTVTVESVRRHPGARPVQLDITATRGAEHGPVDPPSLAAFIVDRYRYYTETVTGSLRYAGVDHGPWPLYDADLTVRENTLFRANRFPDTTDEPTCYYSPGVDSTLTRSLRVRRRPPAAPGP